MGQPPPPTRYGTAAPAAQLARRPATPARPAAPGPVMQCFFAGSGPAAGQAGRAYPAPHGFRLPAGPGQKLPEGVRQRLEQAFRSDFSGVRIHLGTEPGAIGALAFTAGDRIVMAPGQYAPDTARGQRLLAHELAHVVQQRAGRVRNPLGAELAIVHDLQLEAEAERLATQMAARQTPALQMRPSEAAGRAPAAPTLQAYFVMGYYSLWRKDPTAYQPRVYPYAVVGDTTFTAQEKRDPTRGEDEYLRSNGGANLKKVTITSASLRVSDDYEMAIEDSNLRLRQPKAFFATDTVLNASAQALKTAGSPITLHKTGKKIRIVGWSSSFILYEVRPHFNGEQPDKLPQNCNDMARAVVNVDSREGKVVTVATDRLRQFLNKPARSAITEQDLKNYVGLANGKSAKTAGVNAHAAPEVGEAFMIGSVTNNIDLYDQLSKAQKRLHRSGEDTTGIDQQMSALSAKKSWRDYGDKVDREMRWPYHFAGVVAKSGGDRITLENYARGDGAVGAPDPRWFFQMYGGKSGQSFHEANKGADFVNPITIRFNAR